MSTDTRNELQSKLRDDLNIIARKLRIARYRSLNKDDLISAILKCNESRVRQYLSVTWWDRYHNHVYGCVTVVAFVFSIVFFLIPYVNSYKKTPHVIREPSVPVETPEVTSVRPIVDQQTSVFKSFTAKEGKIVSTGILSVFWEVILSNNGATDLSILEYDIAQVSKDFDPINYSHMKQGIYILKDDLLNPVQFPFIIPSGHSVALFLRVGVTMGEQAYDLIKYKYTSQQKTNLKDITIFLRLEGMDFYGNPFSKDELGGFSLPPLDQLEEQVFMITFKTGRGNRANCLISWYKYGIFRDYMQEK